MSNVVVVIAVSAWIGKIEYKYCMVKVVCNNDNHKYGVNYQDDSFD